MIPLFTAAQVRAADNYAIKKLGIPGIVLMENASLSIFHSILEYIPDLNFNDTVGIVAGKGNNGGDGFALARQFVNAGIPVHVISIGREKALKGDALTNYRIFKNLIASNRLSTLTTFSTLRDLNKLSSCLIIVDAILGTGSKGELRDQYLSIIKKLNSFDAIRVAVDLPSGLEVDTSVGEMVFRADLTVTLADYKTGLFYGKGYSNSGKIIKGSIGIGNHYFDRITVSNYLIEPEDALLGLPNKTKNLHKYSNGKVYVIAGSGKYPGAAALTTNSVLKAGSGSAVLAYPKSVRSLITSKIEEAVLDAYDDMGSEALNEFSFENLKSHIDWADLLIIGPGLGRNEETINSVGEIIEYSSGKRVVIDADAIFALSKFGLRNFNLNNFVLTPHHAEFANLIGVSIDKLQSDLLKYGKAFVIKNECTLVLKGAPTIIFTKDGDALINSTGNVGMAKFGAGDVLSGIIGGLSSVSANFEESTISAVYLHSLSADLLLEEYTEFGITPTLIMENLHNAISFLRNSII